MVISTKRIRLRIDIPSFQISEATRLAQTLAVPVAETSAMTPGYWWERDMGENVWMEITRRDDIGADLNAPVTARGGRMTASYVLMPLVQPGDVSHVIGADSEPY